MYVAAPLRIWLFSWGQGGVTHMGARSAYVITDRQPCLAGVQSAVLGTIAEGKHLTGDLGGSSRTSDFTKAIIGNMQ